MGKVTRVYPELTDTWHLKSKKFNISET